MAAYIGDGMAESAYLKAVPKQFEEVRFTFRPATSEERSEFLDQVSRLPPIEQERKSAQFLEQKIVTWSIRNRKGDLLPVKADVLRKLHPTLFDRMRMVVLGTAVWDDDPTALS